QLKPANSAGKQRHRKQQKQWKSCCVSAKGTAR
ncbi:MAG: hypothetical protein ACI9G1_002564, partial [Pirellulaceae bacterium]